MTKSELIQIVKNRVYQNSTKDITGKALQDTLLDIIDECYNEESSDNVVINSADTPSLDTKIEARNINVAADGTVTLNGVLVSFTGSNSSFHVGIEDSSEKILMSSPRIEIEGSSLNNNYINIGNNSSTLLNIGGSNSTSYFKGSSIGITSENNLNIQGGVVQITNRTAGVPGEVKIGDDGWAYMKGTGVMITNNQNQFAKIQVSQSGNIEIAAEHVKISGTPSVGEFSIANAFKISALESDAYLLYLHPVIIDQLKQLLGIDNESFD